MSAEHTPRLSIFEVVHAARTRLARVAGRELLLRRNLSVLLIAAALGAARPLYWPIGDDAPLWLGVILALAVMAGACLLGFLLLLLWGRRYAPTELGAARSMDEALGLREVVASGFAFERDGRTSTLVSMARRRAEQAVTGFLPRAAFVLPSLRPRWRRVALTLGLAAAVAIVGSYHPALASILAAPPTEREMAAAGRLEQLAEELARESRDNITDPDRRPSPEERNRDNTEADASRQESQIRLAQKAKTLSRAARRGDREGALRQLDDLSRDGREAAGQSKALREALRQIAQALESRPARSSKASKSSSESGSGAGSKKAGGTKSGATSEEGTKRAKAGKNGTESAVEKALRSLAEKIRASASKKAGAGGREGSKAGSKASKEHRATMEALARAVARSEAAASKAGSAGERTLAQQLAEALSNAGKSLGAGRRAEASRQLEEATRRAAKLEAARARAAHEAEAIMRMLEAAGMLGKAMQLALAAQNPGSKLAKRGMSMGSGRGGNGKGMGSGMGMGKSPGEAPSSSALARALALRLAALGVGSANPSGLPGRGHEGSADNWGAPRKGLPVKGSIRARAAVNEGDLAVTAIQGLGRSTEPTKEYRNVYPTYSALAEESMADEVVPAAQRHVVRRYFEAIRPGGAETGAASESATAGE